MRNTKRKYFWHIENFSFLFQSEIVYYFYCIVSKFFENGTNTYNFLNLETK